MSILAEKYFSNEAAAFSHLERLLWPNDRAVRALKGAVGKRLTYRGPDSVDIPF